MRQTDVGKRIANRRKEKGLTQLQLAERLNVSNRTVSKWENGDGYPDITILPNLSDILEISIDELIRGEELCDIAEKEQATTDDLLNKSKTNKAGLILKVVSFGLVIFAAIIGITTELMYYKCRSFFYFPIETYLEIASAVILAAGVIIYCCYNIKNQKSKSIFERSNYFMTVLASVFPFFFFFRCSHWFMNIPEIIGFIVFYSYLIAVVVSFIVFIKKQKENHDLE